MKSELTDIKNSLKSQIGNNLVIKIKKTRKLAFRGALKQEATLLEIYPRIFIIELKNTESMSKRMSFSYVDILTSSVELSFV